MTRKETGSKKIWDKPLISEFKISKITLSGSSGNKENTGNDDQTIRVRNLG